MSANESDDVCYPQPQSIEERLAVANDFRRRFRYELPLVVDTLEDTAMWTYSAWPERLYVVDEEGIVQYVGDMGPLGFEPDEVEEWLLHRFGQGR